MIFTFGDFEIDDELYQLRVRGVRTQIQPKAFDVLLYLLRHRDRVVLKEELLERVWNGVHVTDNALSQAVAGARAALETEDVIATVRGRGYRFALPVEEQTIARRAIVTDRDRLVAILQGSIAGLRGGVVVDAVDGHEIEDALGLVPEAKVLRTREGDSAPLAAWRALAVCGDRSGDPVGEADDVLGVLEGASPRSPIVVVFDRIDRADVASILLFVHVARSPRPNVALVGTVDLDAIARGGELSQALGRLAWRPAGPRSSQESGITYRGTDLVEAPRTPRSAR